MKLTFPTPRSPGVTILRQQDGVITIGPVGSPPRLLALAMGAATAPLWATGLYLTLRPGTADLLGRVAGLIMTAAGIGLTLFAWRGPGKQGVYLTLDAAAKTVRAADGRRFALADLMIWIRYSDYLNVRESSLQRRDAPVWMVTLVANYERGRHEPGYACTYLDVFRRGTQEQARAVAAQLHTLGTWKGQVTEECADPVTAS